ncbi:hypothetical protein ZWY2020_046287 [Hordeum vulgare]|nr:hypothetical protein ZWY2020_046287 [Hordeum vulgare]
MRRSGGTTLSPTSAQSAASSAPRPPPRGPGEVHNNVDCEKNTSEVKSSDSQDSLQLSTHHDVAMDLINSVTGVDEEGRSRKRILTFAAKRYISAIERNPEDPDAYYNWALVLQESADRIMDPQTLTLHYLRRLARSMLKLHDFAQHCMTKLPLSIDNMP